jgi:hypothetical protein
MTVANVDRAALEAKVKDMYTEVAETDGRTRLQDSGGR